MAVNRRDVVDAIVANIARYGLLFGLATHLYDTRQRQLVHSPVAHCYSLLLHVTLVVLFPYFYKYRSRTNGSYTQSDTHFFEQLFLLLLGVTFLSIFVSIGSKWTLRAREPKLLNEIIQLWHKDIAHLRSSGEIRRKTCGLFTCKALTTTLVVLNSTFITFINAGITLSISQSIYILPLFNIITAVGFQFCSGLIFCQYMFRILSYNMARVVRDIHSLCNTRRPRHAVCQKVIVLERELSELGRLHEQLRKWVVRFKDIYQVELVPMMTAFLVMQVFMIFVVCVVIYEDWIDGLLSIFFTVCATVILAALDVTLLFYVCGSLLSASDGAGVTMKDMPVRRLPCIRLERCIEMTCLQLMREKLRLTICGMIDLDWSMSFIVAEAGLLYVIYLLQMDFKNL